MTERRAEKGPRVSVVIPAYNAADSLAEAVASVQRQSLTDLEIIIVDDASQDETASVAKELAAGDARVRVVSARQNGGPAAARNLGFAAAQGSWIALLDSDDAFEPARLERLTAAAEDLGADLLADNLLLEDEEGRCEPMLAVAETAELSPVSAAGFLRGNLPDPARPRRSYGFLKPVFRRAFLEAQRLRYDETLRFAEDFAFYLDCLGAGGRFFLLNAPLYRYRLRADSLTARHSIEDLRRLQAVDRRLLDSLRRGGSADLRSALKEHKRSIDRRLQWRVVIDAVKRRDWLGAVGAGLKGWHVFTYVSGQLSAEAWRRFGPGRSRGRARAAET